MNQKSYDKSEYGKLYLIPTPIGNLNDITYRSIETFKMVDIVYAEDTRETYNLLKYYNIDKRIESCHKYSEMKHKDKIISILKSGKNIGYSTDRGTPIISDPGNVIVEEAIKDAQENAALNNINNIEFIQGDCEQAFKELLEKDVVPTAIIVDPPRSGLDETTVNNLNKLKLEKLSYISCNPATLMRDLHMLEETYKITSLTPVDNFCYSSSIETVATLERK